MGGKRASVASRGVQPFIHLHGERRPGRGRGDGGLQEDQLPALAGVPEPGLHPEVLAAQPATLVLTPAHCTQHPHRRKTTFNHTTLNTTLLRAEVKLSTGVHSCCFVNCLVWSQACREVPHLSRSSARCEPSYRSNH